MASLANGTTINGSTAWHAGNDGSGSGLDADTLDGVQGSSFLRSDATDYLTSTLYTRGDLVSGENGYRNRGMFGVYDSYKTAPIWSMGTAYRNHADGTNFGNLYGLAYKHTNNATGGPMAGGHQMVWCQNGGPTAAIGSGIWTNGDINTQGYVNFKNIFGTQSNGAWVEGTMTANSFSGDGSQLTGIQTVAGGGTDAVFHLNDQAVTTSYTIPFGKNAMTAGDITINTGVTVTISTGSRWVIV